VNDIDYYIHKIHNLEPWSTDKDISDNGWREYISLARELCSLTGDDMVSIIDAYVLYTYNNPSRNPYVVDNSRLALLFRVMFNIPEIYSSADEPISLSVCAFGLDYWSKIHGKPTLSWPVKWINGKPALVTNIVGHLIWRYYARADYLYLSDRYPLRY
jgi:hypothetical protein